MSDDGMNVTLTSTSAREISQALINARRIRSTSGLVFTLVVITDPDHVDAVYHAALGAGREHPSRILVVVPTESAEARLDAEIHTSAEVPGEVVVLRPLGALREHTDSVVLPLLLPDSPVIVWWPHESPHKPAEDPVGRLGTRRITDASGANFPLAALEIRAKHHEDGDTDLTWTRLTPWRALLAAGLDQYPATVTSASVAADPNNAPAELMASWLEARLQVPVTTEDTEGPGLTAVHLTTDDGDIVVSRESGSAVATYAVPGQPPRKVALNRRRINELITEELRRTDHDDIFEQAMAQLLKRRQAERGDDESANEGTGE